MPILPSQDKAAADTEKDVATATTSSTDDVSADAKTKGTCDAEVADKYLYTEVVKRPSTSSLDMLDEEREEEEEAEGGEREGEQHPGFTDNLAVYKSNKNTTDSGFYSVKEVNSDSESGSEVKTDNGSPAQESCSSSAAQEGTTLPECNNNPATRISDCAAPSNGGKQVIEEEEEESALEKTMTSDDFKDGLSERGSDVVSAVSVESQCDVRAVSDSSVVQNGVKGVVKDQDNGDVSVTSETHVPTKPVVDTQTANGDDTQQPDKAKKKKKKSKNKKNKQKPSEQENAPTENHVNDTVTDTTSKPKSHKSKQDSSRSDVPAIPATNSSNIHAVSTDMSSSSTRKNTVPSGKELDVSEATTAATTAAEAAATASGNIGGKATGSAVFSRLGGEGECRPGGGHVYARVEAVKARSEDGRTPGGKLDKASLHLDLQSVGHSKKKPKSKRDSGDSTQSVEDDLLDSWGLSSILTRGLSPAQSGFDEDDENESHSPREVILCKRQHGGDLPRSSCVQTVSGSEAGLSGVGCSSQSDHRSSWQKGDIFWDFFSHCTPCRTLSTAGLLCSSSSV